MSKKSSVPTGRPDAVKILPISADDLRNPEKFSAWIFAHGPLILQELFANLPDANANERVKILADLYKTTLNYRPFVPAVPADNAEDPAAALAALLAQPVLEEEDD